MASFIWSDDERRLLLKVSSTSDCKFAYQRKKDFCLMFQCLEFSIWLFQRAFKSQARSFSKPSLFCKKTLLLKFSSCFSLLFFHLPFLGFFQFLSCLIFISLSFFFLVPLSFLCFWVSWFPFTFCWGSQHQKHNLGFMEAKTVCKKTS
jgi:hypothetical protein